MWEIGVVVYYSFQYQSLEEGRWKLWHFISFGCIWSQRGRDKGGNGIPCPEIERTNNVENHWNITCYNYFLKEFSFRAMLHYHGKEV